jgi:hypothetical protein
MKALGFISAPDWLDPAPDEFRQLTNGAVPVQQTFLGPPGFDYRTESIAQSEPKLIHAARQLAGAGCTLIASPATSFGFVGYNNISEARAGLTRIGQAACCLMEAGRGGTEQKVLDSAQNSASATVG